MAEKPISRFRLNELARRRLAAMARDTGKSPSELVELAITNLRAVLLRGDGVVMTIPDEPDGGPQRGPTGGGGARSGRRRRVVGAISTGAQIGALAAQLFATN